VEEDFSNEDLVEEGLADIEDAEPINEDFSNSVPVREDLANK